MAETRDFRKFGPELNHFKNYFRDLSVQMEEVRGRLKLNGPPLGDFPQAYELLWRMLEQQGILKTQAIVLVEEIPLGAIDGANTKFSISFTPRTDAWFILTYNGLEQEQGTGRDFTLAGTAITMAAAPRTLGRLKVRYVKA